MTFLQSSVLDFGKIIIYTSNLRIIRAPPKKPDMIRQHSVPPLDLEGCPKAMDRGSRRRKKTVQEEESGENAEKGINNTDTKVIKNGQNILNGVVGFFYHLISVSCYFPFHLSIFTFFSILTSF